MTYTFYDYVAEQFVAEPPLVEAKFFGHRGVFSYAEQISCPLRGNPPLQQPCWMTSVTRTTNISPLCAATERCVYALPLLPFFSPSLFSSIVPRLPLLQLPPLVALVSPCLRSCLFPPCFCFPWLSLFPPVSLALCVLPAQGRRPTHCMQYDVGRPNHSREWEGGLDARSMMSGG